MSKAIPKIQKFMTTVPICINRTDTVASAHKVMREHDIRHLPVVDGDKLVGIVTQRDLHLIETLKDVDANNVNVEDAMTTNPYTVHPDAELDEVVAEMAEQKYGSALVVQNHKVVGVFTTVDAMRAFSELLKSRLTH
ncbi:MAG TPA: CBS domain-containing protein [Polyangium sp.]|jgi:acetoin utilization protein AcuB|nr:CBS domain-containing protein [Polyangium sp.]